MADPVPRLNAALEGRYTIERDPYRSLVSTYGVELWRRPKVTNSGVAPAVAIA